MGLGSSKPQVETFNPTPQFIRPLQGDISGFLQGVFNNPAQSPFAGAASPLQQQAVGNISTFLNMPSPEMQTLNAVERPLQGMVNAAPLQNPFGDLGAVNRAQQVISAAQPIFQQNLQTALGQLANRSPAVTNTAFGQQAGNVANQALQNFNLFQQQALQQGLNQQLQERQAALNFALGAGALQQQGALGAAELLGQLAGQAGAAPFNRALAAGQLGLGLTQQNVNPTLQLLLGGLNFAQPMGQQAIVQQGGGGLGGFLGSLGGLALGSVLGPLGSTLGAGLGNRILGKSGSDS